MGAERDILQGGWGAMEIDGPVGEHGGIERQIDETGVLAVIAIDADLKAALQMIDLNEFAGNRVRRALRRELTIDELIPFRGVALLARVLFRGDRTVGIRAEFR